VHHPVSDHTPHPLHPAAVTCTTDFTDRRKETVNTETGGADVQNVFCRLFISRPFRKKTRSPRRRHDWKNLNRVGVEKRPAERPSRQTGVAATAVGSVVNAAAGRAETVTPFPLTALTVIAKRFDYRSARRRANRAAGVRERAAADGSTARTRAGEARGRPSLWIASDRPFFFPGPPRFPASLCSSRRPTLALAIETLYRRSHACSPQDRNRCYVRIVIFAGKFDVDCVASRITRVTARFRPSVPSMIEGERVK